MALPIMILYSLMGDSVSTKPVHVHSTGTVVLKNKIADTLYNIIEMSVLQLNLKLGEKLYSSAPKFSALCKEEISTFMCHASPPPCLFPEVYLYVVWTHNRACLRNGLVNNNSTSHSLGYKTHRVLSPHTHNVGLACKDNTFYQINRSFKA